METSRSSRSRFRRSPKAPLDMNQNLSLTIQAQPRKRSFTWATAKRSFMSAAAKRLTRRALTKNRLGIPRRHYRQVIRCCQTERKWEIDERGRVLGNEAPSGLSGERGHTEGVRHLIELGVDAGAVYKEGDEYFDVARNSTALHVAAWRAQHATVKLLIERGAPIDVLDGKGRTPLALAVRACVDSYWKHRRSPASGPNLLPAGAALLTT